MKNFVIKYPYVFIALVCSLLLASGYFFSISITSFMYNIDFWTTSLLESESIKASRVYEDAVNMVVACMVGIPFVAYFITTFLGLLFDVKRASFWGVSAMLFMFCIQGFTLLPAVIIEGAFNMDLLYYFVLFYGIFIYFGSKSFKSFVQSNYFVNVA